MTGSCLDSICVVLMRVVMGAAGNMSMLRGSRAGGNRCGVGHASRRKHIATRAVKAIAKAFLPSHSLVSDRFYCFTCLSLVLSRRRSSILPLRASEPGKAPPPLPSASSPKSHSRASEAHRHHLVRQAKHLPSTLLNPHTHFKSVYQPPTGAHRIARMHSLTRSHARQPIQAPGTPPTCRSRLLVLMGKQASCI